jgi:signal transduction histidine kinase
MFVAPHFGPLLLLGDTAIILFGLSWSQGLSQDLLLVYFFTVFLLTVGETLGQIAIGSALIVAGYGYWLWVSGEESLRPEAWVRLPFFFLVAIFYASLIEQLKRERRRRREAENQNEHLRLMLDLASVFSEAHATREFVRGIGRFIEGTCPGIECSMVLRESTEDPEPGVTEFPLRAHGKHYGALCVRTADERDLQERESWLCQMVAHAAAGALYAAEQSDAARAAAEAKDQFLANVSHEFRTPLHAILGYIDVLDTITDATADTLVRESIERLRVNTCRLQHLLEEILSFAEIRAGRRAVRAEKVSLRQVVSELVPITRELLAGKPVSLTWEIPAGADELWTDGRKLQRVLSCLLSNAAKFTERGEISVSARRRDGGAVEIEVGDTGIGIASGDLDVIFDEFRQVDGSFTRRYGGVGLGLALARELVVILDGTLELESAPAEGTKVRIRIPRAAPRAAPQIEALAQAEDAPPVARVAAVG